VNVILDSLGVADEPDPTYANTEEPRPDDLIDYEQDYEFGAGDIVRISIYELRQVGIPFVNDYVVTESGRISVPDVGQIRAAGLTEVKLEDEIKHSLTPGILKDPSVTVILLQSERRMFSIYGQGVGQPGRFIIPRYTFRITDAIALAGDVGQFNVSYIYVSRAIPVASAAADTISARPEPAVDTRSVELDTVEPSDNAGAGRKASAEDEMLELIQPYAGSTSHSNIPVIASAELATDAESAQAGRIEWVFENGKWMPKTIATASAKKTQPAKSDASRIDSGGIGTIAVEERLAGEYGLDQIGAGNVKTRVIKIPIDKLKSGDPRYDIIIRPGDRISVPVDIIGEFWVTGNVNNQGLINLTGRPMTLKMAIAAAGGLGPLAWPRKVEVVRRVGRNSAGLMQEEIVMVDLEKIAKGQQPDFFIKPYDLVNVGTHGTSRWLAVLRNAFRATYGFGFLYDRNFSLDRYYR
jgi:polysaccharide export outer membrane protein